MSSYFFPTPENDTILEYQDSHPRSYYCLYNETENPNGYHENEGEQRERLLLKNAIESVKSQIESCGVDFDKNDDGIIDNVIFVLQGSADSWGDILWPMSKSLLPENILIDGKQVGQYNKQLSNWFNVDLFSHEFFHTLGAPDLYRYTNDEIEPVGAWDIMGTTGAQHMTTYMKWKYGKWFDAIPEITVPGTYFLAPVSQNPYACYKIPSPKSSTEYFMIEYRKKEGLLENSLPDTYDDGLIIYRINAEVPWGNAGGPPDEVYVYRPGGDSLQNGQISKASFSANVSRTLFNNETSPSCFLSSGEPGWIDISNISGAGNEISFNVNEINPLPKPKNFRASEANGSILFTWEAPQKTDYVLQGYHIYLKGDNSPLNTSLITDTSFTFSIPGQEPLYSFQLIAEYQEGTSDSVTCLFANTSDPFLLDSLALVALYNQCDGPNWLNNDNWLEGPLDTWYGVTVENKRVTILDLSDFQNRNNGLKNSLPNEIGNLTALQILELSFNSLTGNIPKRIGDLMSLKVLKVNSNRLSGEIPEELFELSTLQILQLIENNLSGEISDSISRLTNLEQMYLHQNNISGELPKGIFRLKNIKVIGLNDNELFGKIPEEIGELVRLESLELGYNNFTDSIPGNLWTLSNLRQLNLSGKFSEEAGLKGEISSRIVNLNKLEGLTLSYNQLSGEIFFYLCRLPNLNSVWIQNNDFSGEIPPEIADLNQLQDIRISNNNFSGELPFEFGHLIKINCNLDLYNNQFHGSIPPGVANFTEVISVSFANNKFDALPAMTNSPNMWGLALGENRFTFEDIEPNMDIDFAPGCNGLTYQNQSKIGKTETKYAPVNEPYTLSIYCGGENNRYQWFKNGSAVSGVSGSPDFIIENVTAGNNGKYFCRVTNTLVTDLTIESYPVTVIGNNTLIAHAGNDFGADEGSLVTLNGTASNNPAGEPLTYKWTAPEGIELDLTDAAQPVFIAPEVIYDTEYIFTLVVNNGVENSTPDEVVVTVKNLKNAPVANAGFDQTVYDSENVILDGSGSYDSDSDDITYLWIAPEGIELNSVTNVQPVFVTPEISGDTVLVFKLVVDDGIFKDSDQVVITLVDVKKGCPRDTYYDEIPSSGVGGEKIGQSVTVLRSGILEKIELTVWPEGSEPYLILREWQSDEYDFAFDGQIIATSDNAINKPSTENWHEMSTFYFSSNPNLKAGEKYLIEVVDGLPYVIIPGTYTGGKAYETLNPTYERDMRFALYICPKGNTLVADAGPNQTVYEGEAVVLDGTCSLYPDVDSVSYQWKAPEGITLSNVNEPQCTFVAPEVVIDTTLTFYLTVSDFNGYSDTSKVEITIKNSVNVGIHSIESIKFYVYPNPTDGMVNFKLENGDNRNFWLLVTSVLGEKIIQEEIHYFTKFQLNLADQPAGIYLIQLINDEKRYFEKLIIK